MKSLLLVVEHIFVFINRVFEKITNSTKPAHVLCYQSYSNGERTRLLGRVVEKISHTEFSKDQRHLKHFVKVIKLFLTKKIDHATLEVEISEEEKHVFNSNEEGFFSEVIEKSPAKVIPIKLLSTHNDEIKIAKTNFEIPINSPSKEVEKIYISDIDDTIIQSKAVSMISLVANTFSPISKRIAFKEAAKVYNELKDSASVGKQNLFFYVSSSTWNLYPLLRGFMKENRFPNGPLLLQDIATEKKKNHSNSHQHKFDRIEEIISFFPNSRYTLIGDAGQKDASIYLDIASKYPGNVDLILIRHTWWTKEFIEPDEHKERAKKLGITLVYFDSLENLDEETIKILES